MFGFFYRPHPQPRRLPGLRAGRRPRRRPARTDGHGDLESTFAAGTHVARLPAAALPVAITLIPTGSGQPLPAAVDR
jgi:hypothetical protein